MPRVAIAIPESHAHSIHEEMLRHDPLEGFSSAGYACPHCCTAFVIFFTDNLDPENPTYEVMLQDRIAESCQMGRHPFDSLPLATS
jgi:hypothetical protein